MKTMELVVCSTFFLEQIHAGAARVGCVWLRKFGVELIFWIWSCVELSQTRPMTLDPNSPQSMCSTAYLDERKKGQ
jgi:hypothetical protein